jgi:hypothetical protein
VWGKRSLALVKGGALVRVAVEKAWSGASAMSNLLVLHNEYEGLRSLNVGLLYGGVMDRIWFV